MNTYDIFDDLLQLRDMVDSYFASVPGKKYSTRDYPYVNLYEKEDNFKITAVLPGVRQEDLDIQLVDNSIQIRGQRKDDHRNENYIRTERTFGTFSKTIKLPAGIDRESIKAALANGILEISLKKSADAMPRKIEIK